MKTKLLTLISLIMLPSVVYGQLDLDGLKKRYAEEIERAVAPIDKKYQDALIRLRDGYTRAGDLAAANKVQDELNVKFPQVTKEDLQKSKVKLEKFSFDKIKDYEYHFTTHWGRRTKIQFKTDDVSGSGGLMAMYALDPGQSEWWMRGRRLLRWFYDKNEVRTIVKSLDKEDTRWGFGKKIVFSEDYLSATFVEEDGQEYKMVAQKIEN